jgi:hypothetical protein
MGAMKFQILIPTMPGREAMLAELLTVLEPQLKKGVGYLTDAAPGTIGAKRQRMIEAATADYIAFVDDLFAVWLKGPRPGNELWACPELGMSHGYQVSAFPHTWPDAIRARREILSAWKNALRRTS